MTTNTDPNGISMSTLTGTRKQQVKTIAPLGATTTFTYDALGQLLQSTDPCGLSTLYTYDQLGRVLSRTHPDAGTDSYTYDGAGNLLAQVTQRLATTGGSIRYHYTYNRLDSVICPETPINNVYYTYGSPTAANNQRGRISFMEDASGFQTFIYGKLGEVVENYHTFAVPNETQPYTFQMKFTYDTWNRVQNMTYPDGEVVSYAYNLGGMLNSVTGIKGTMHFKYIDSIHYNEFELKSGQWYGNGARTQYFYDTLMRLSQLKCFSGPSPLLQDILYKYDAVGNILAITNSANINSAGLGGNYSMKYAYDSLYRLQSSSGDLMGTKTFDYQLRMAYASNGRILKKRQLARCYSSTFMDTLMNYVNMYDYGTTPVNNHLQAISDSLTGPSMSFAWDVNGNMSSQTVVTSTTPSMVRIHCWDEENRMQGSTDAKHTACYFYDGAGERFFKFSGVPQTMNINGEWHTYHSLTDPVLYASPYLIATPNSYTKHYYAESERIACKVGSGYIPNLHSVCSTTANFHAKRDSNYMHIKKILNCLGADVNVLKMNVFGGLVNAAQGDDIEYGIYYYHPDHLGSASWITDKIGKGIQYLYYLPWGEELVNQRCTSFESRFTFSGKERDEETGYSYFGARLHNPTLSIWLSVDPMSDKYPGVSPYTYCGNNPVRLVDPDGREIWIVGDDADAAFQQLQNQTNLTLSIDKDGKLSYSGEAKSEIDKALSSAMDDSQISVTVIAQKENIFGGIRTESGGAYMGNTYDEGTVCAEQYVCPSMLADFDKSVGDKSPGLTMVHEVMESYYGGQIALDSKEGSPYAGVEGSTYDQAHLRANQIVIGNKGPNCMRIYGISVNPKFPKFSQNLFISNKFGYVDFIINWERRTDDKGM